MCEGSSILIMCIFCLTVCVYVIRSIFSVHVCLIVCVFIRLSFRLFVRGNGKKFGEYGMRNEEEREKDGGEGG